MGFDPMIGSELEFFFNQTYEEIHNGNTQILRSILVHRRL